MGNFLDSLIVKAPKLAPIPSLGSDASAGYWGFIGSEGTPDILRLRGWKETNPLIFAGVSLIRGMIANAQWEILPIDPKKPYAKRAQLAIHDKFANPNPGGKNNSFSALNEPVVDDLIVAALGAILPYRDDLGRSQSMVHLDAGRVRFMPDWESDKDGPRYVVMNKQGTGGKMLRNDQLITIQANSTTYSEIGVAPLRVLHETLMAQRDTFNRLHMQHKHGTPAGMMNVSGITDEQLTRMRRQIYQSLESNASIGLFNYPAEFVNYIPLGTTDNQKQMVMDWFHYLSATIEAALGLDSGTLLRVQLEDGPKGLQSSLQRGVVPYMRLMAGYFNREIVASWGDTNLQFVWTELAVNNEPQDAQVIRTRAGTSINWTSINQLAKADGLEPYTYADKDIQVWVDEPLISIAPGQLAPVSVAAKLPQYHPEVMEAQAQAKIEGANNAAHQIPDAGAIGGQQQREPEPERTPQPQPEPTDDIQNERRQSKHLAALDAELEAFFQRAATK